MMRIAGLCAAGLMSCCTVRHYQAQPTVRFAFPSLDVAGACASSLTVDDVRQIKHLADRHDVLKPIDQIVADHPDEAEVKCGHPEKSGDPITTFEVRKKNGRWIISKKPYTSTETIVTS